MEVTRENFKTLLPTIEADIDDAEFFTIDGEFTGLNNGIETNTYDTPAEYYKKLKDGSMEFLFFQFGLAAFKFDEATKKYNHKAYNFYLFPRPNSKTRHVADSRFLCQSSCIDFLAEHGFDFNKVFKQGISYLNSCDEEKALDLLENRKKNLLDSDNEIITVPSDFKLCVENACAQVEDFIKSEDKEREIVLLKNNAFAKKLVHQQVSKRFSEKGIGLVSSNKSMLARKDYNKEKEIIEKYEAEKIELQDAVGFTLVMRKLAESDKLIVGHNLLLDLCHILNQFFAPLPQEYSEFKYMLHDTFPRLLDTKYMCYIEPFKSFLSTSTLAHLVPAISEVPFELPEVGCIDKGYGYEPNSTKNHEAGFDAYITGLVFIAFSNFLASKKTGSNDIPVTQRGILTPFINRLHLMKVNDSYINICGNDPVCSRKHVFYVTFPSRWRFKQIADLFQPVGTILVNWITDASAWVTLNDVEMADSVPTLIDTSSYNDVTIQTYEQRKSVTGGSPTSGTPSSTASGTPSGTASGTPSGTPSGPPVQLFSPVTSSALKKRKRDVQSTAGSGASAALAAAARRRSRSRESFSRRSFETIPEESEDVDSPIRKKRLIVEFEELPKKDQNVEFDENDSWD